MFPGATLKPKTMHDTIDGRTDASDFPLEESESLSDIDDFEVCKLPNLISL